VARIIDLFQLSTLTLATSGAGAEPHAAPLHFVAIGHPFGATQDLMDMQDLGEAEITWRIYFFSEEKSQHSRDLLVNSHAAATLYPESQDWRQIRGLQLRGTVQQVPLGPEWDQAWEQYRLKFPFVVGLKNIVARNNLYVFVPTWIRLVDNRLGFGFKHEWIFDSKDVEDKPT
jgi:uncharacterized protein YhbP (UPF0306 family)